MGKDNASDLTMIIRRIIDISSQSPKLELAISIHTTPYHAKKNKEGNQVCILLWLQSGPMFPYSPGYIMASRKTKLFVIDTFFGLRTAWRLVMTTDLNQARVISGHFLYNRT